MKKLRYIFALLAFLLLIAMLLMSRDAGINCDEVLHYNHSITVLSFFSTHGRDTSAINTPVTHLKYYGQSYDNLTTWLTRILKIDDIYGFRHLMSSLAGWLAIMVTALFAIWLEGYGAGIIVLVLFALSPTFLGHAQNNLKDIPFALSYIAGIWFILRFLSGRGEVKIVDILMLVISIAFCISIRPGGLILIFYLFLFWCIIYGILYLKTGRTVIKEALQKALHAILISGAAYFAGILFWPYALLDPLWNVIGSYRVMVHFPDTFRQIFEGVSEYSDFMPWYYLPKSMMITIPLIVLAGLILYMIFFRQMFKTEKSIFHVLLILSTLFPLLFILVTRSNLYSSWRHFMFIYPGLVIISSSGILYLFRIIRQRLFYVIPVAILMFLAAHPLMYLIRNHRYAYIYYNQLTGGLRGAYGNYETDYYFVSQRESAEWLSKYIERNKSDDTIVVGSNFSADWFFRKNPLVKNRYIRYEERNNQKWDYAIITNRYITPFQLKNRLWPPSDALHTVYADGVPVSDVIKRKSESSYLGYKALENNNIDKAMNYFKDALRADSTDDMIFYNFAVALYRKGSMEKADSVLHICLKLNPDSDMAMMFLGDIAAEKGNGENAKNYYENVIRINRKYPAAYMSLAKLFENEDIMKTRSILRNCIEVNPKCTEAIVMLGNTYMKKDPEIAEKYFDLARTIK